MGMPGSSRAKAVGPCIVCGETQHLHKYFGSHYRNQCKNCQAYFVYELARAAQASEDIRYGVTWCGMVRYMLLYSYWADALINSAGHLLAYQHKRITILSHAVAY